MARIRFIRGTALGGIGNDVAPGDERDLPDGEAHRFVLAGRAVLLANLDTPLAPASADADAHPVEGSKPKRRKG
jgi:hypothetical protein